MEKILKKKGLIKKLIIGLIIFFIGIGVGSAGSTNKTDFNKLQKDYETLKDEKEKLEKQTISAQEYLSLKDSEKTLIDNEITEIKKATEEELKQKEEEETKKKEEAEAKKKAEEDAKKQAEAEAVAQKAAEEQAQKEAAEAAQKEAEAHKYETGLTWEQIAREGHEGEYGQFEGRVIQVMNGNGYSQYRVAINDNYDQIMLVEIDSSILNPVLLENDYIYFKGKSAGTMTYSTVLGAQMTVPAFIIDEYNL